MPLVHFHLADSPIICGDHCPVLDVHTIYVKDRKRIRSESWRDQGITDYRMPSQQPQRLPKTYCTMIPYSAPPLHSLVCVHHIIRAHILILVIVGAHKTLATFAPLLRVSFPRQWLSNRHVGQRPRLLVPDKSWKHKLLDSRSLSGVEVNCIQRMMQQNAAQLDSGTLNARFHGWYKAHCTSLLVCLLV